APPAGGQDGAPGQPAQLAQAEPQLHHRALHVHHRLGLHRLHPPLPRRRHGLHRRPLLRFGRLHPGRPQLHQHQRDPAVPADHPHDHLLHRQPHLHQHQRRLRAPVLVREEVPPHRPAGEVEPRDEVADDESESGGGTERPRCERIGEGRQWAGDSGPARHYHAQRHERAEREVLPHDQGVCGE
ncbi:hypothetical protein LTR53_018795, partial [Teratosphaeriaceae sp. CCFEE 6253]